MIDYKKSKAPITTVTRNVEGLDAHTGSLYETLVIVAKRSNQISAEIKKELNRKLEEFAYYTDNLEEVFENREQIEISKFYERLPKPSLMALEEYLESKVYFRRGEVQSDESI